MDLSVMVEDVKFNYRAGLIIRRNHQILVECNPKFDFTTIPGGRIKTLESSVEGLQRELEEEMQIKLQDKELKMKGVIENFFILDGKKYHELFFLYQMTVPKEDKRFKDNMKNHDSKASYYKWVDEDKLEDVNLLPVVVRNIDATDEFKHMIVKDIKK